MDATPIDLGDASARDGPFVSPIPPFADTALALKWSTLHDAADTIATVAGMMPLPVSPEVRSFPAAISAVAGSRRAVAEQQIDDLTAILETGVAALIAAFNRGASPHTAARALAEEFAHARDAVISLLPPAQAFPPVA